MCDHTVAIGWHVFDTIHMNELMRARELKELNLKKKVEYMYSEIIVVVTFRTSILRSLRCTIAKGCRVLFGLAAIVQRA